MKIALLTNVVSPHQMPLAKALVRRVGEANYRYVHTEAAHGERTRMGWGGDAAPAWCVQGTMEDVALVEADCVLSGLRALGLFERRNAAGKATFYAAERWFKPPLGFLRLLVPSYCRMAWRFARCVRAPGFLCLPMGVHAARDMVRIARACMENETIMRLCGAGTYRALFDNMDVTYRNTNMLIQLSDDNYYEGATGMKTGSYNDVKCLVASAELGGKRYVAAIMEDSDGGRYTDAKTLFDYAAGLTEGGTASIDTAGGSGEEGAEEAPSEDQNE